MSKPKEYRVAKPYWRGPHLMSVGDTLFLTDEQAKYRGDEVELVKAEVKTGEVKAGIAKRLQADQPRKDGSES